MLAYPRIDEAMADQLQSPVLPEDLVSEAIPGMLGTIGLIQASGFGCREDSWSTCSATPHLPRPRNIRRAEHFIALLRRDAHESRTRPIMQTCHAAFCFGLWDTGAPLVNTRVTAGGFDFKAW